VKKIRRIQTSLVQAFALLIVLTIVILGAFSLSFFKRTLVGIAEENTTQFLAQLNRVIENYITYMDDIALVLVNNEDVKAYMADPAGSPAASRSRIAQFLGSVRAVRKDIDGIFLLPGEGRSGIIASSPGEGINPDYDFRSRWQAIPAALKARLGQGKPIVTSAHVENIVDGRYPWVISLIRDVRGAEGRRGYIQVNLNYAIIDDLCRNIQLGKSGYVFILDSSGDIVYHPRQQLVYGNLKSERISAVLGLRGGYLSAKVDGRDILYTAVDSAQTGWTVVSVSYLDELFAGSREAEYSFLMLALLCFAVAILVSAFVSVRISRPIESLRRSMQAVESGNFDIDITVNASNEIYQLARDCDIAVKKVRDLIAQNRRDQEQKRDLELRALQAQINPHFLYNTLDSIIWMIELGENEKAIDVTSNLARFFRLGINRGAEIVSLRTEMDYLVTYLSIQKIRYKNKLDYEIAFPPEVLDLRIPKLLVQPLVENAIYHGIKNKEGGGFVRISASKDGGMLAIRVGDDGIGMDAGRLAAVRSSLEQGEPAAAPEADERSAAGAPGGGVGVKNVQERIRLCFGAGYGLDFESAPGQGTVATIRIPAAAEAGQ
jgi:two-component system sensor histidine kinase YesM